MQPYVRINLAFFFPEILTLQDLSYIRVPHFRQVARIDSLVSKISAHLITYILEFLLVSDQVLSELRAFVKIILARSKYRYQSKGFYEFEFN